MPIERRSIIQQIQEVTREETQDLTFGTITEIINNIFSNEAIPTPPEVQEENTPIEPLRRGRRRPRIHLLPPEEPALNIPMEFLPAPISQEPEYPINPYSLVMYENMAQNMDSYVWSHDSLNKIFSEMERENKNEIARHIQRGMYDSNAKDYITYLGIAADDNMKISYLNKSRLLACTNKGQDGWTTKGRYMANPSTVIEKLFPGIYNDKMKEEFTVLYRHIISKQCRERFKIDIVHGETIRKYYWEKNYSKKNSGYGNSNLFQSCKFAA